MAARSIRSPLRAAGVAAVDVGEGLDHLAKGAPCERTFDQRGHDILVVARGLANVIQRALRAVIVLNVFERDGDHTYDTSPVIDADGTLLGKTRMVHITDYDCFHEQGYYAPGNCGAPVYDTKYGRIGVAICYDRHYPEYMRALALNGAQLVVVPQAGAVGEWPDGLFEAELRVASFQNGYYSALCNRVGPEPNVTFAGQSFVCDPAGNIIAQAREGADEILMCEIDLTKVESSHAAKIFLRDRRPELYGEWLS